MYGYYLTTKSLSLPLPDHQQTQLSATDVFFASAVAPVLDDLLVGLRAVGHEAR